MAEDVKDEELDHVVQQAHRCYRDSRDATNEWRTESPKWYDLVANKQWDKEDMDVLAEQDRIPVVINRTARAVNAIIGTQVANRQETRFIPREEGDVKVNEILTGAADWVRDGCDAEDEESDAFEDCVICGMGWTETRLDYEQDPEGMVKIDRIDPLEMYWDPNAKKRNLADAKWFMRIKPVPIDEFEDRWPGKLAGMLSDPWEGPPSELNTREHVYPQEAYNEQQSSAGRAKGRKSIKVAQYQYAERVPMYRVGKAAERITEEAFKKLEEKLDAAGVKYMKQTGVRWKQAFIAGGQNLEEEEIEAPTKKKASNDCPYPDGSTFRPITYKRDRNKNTWYGVVAAMMDPQKYGNKFLSLIMDILRANSKGGVMIEVDAVDNPAQIEEKWAKPDAIVYLRPGAISGKKVQERPKAQLPAGLDRLVAYFLDSVHEVTGINLELLGMANREQAGVLENTRKQAGVTIIAPLFDGLRRYRKEQGRVLLYFIQTYLSDDRLIRITGDKGQQAYVPLTKASGTARYDVIVDESPTSPNMKEKTFGALAELLPQLLKAGVPVPPEILKYMPLPSSLIEKWMQYIEQSGGNPQQTQEQLKKLTEENQQLKSKKDEAMAQLQLDAQKQQAEMQLEREKLTAELEIARVKAANELQIAREKADVQLQLEQYKVQNEARLMESKLAVDNEMQSRKIAMDKEKSQADIALKLHGTKAGIENIAQGVFSKQSQAKRKRRIRFERDRGGELVGAQVEDE